MNNKTPPASDPSAVDAPAATASLGQLYETHQRVFLRQLRRSLPHEDAWDTLHRLFHDLLERCGASAIHYSPNYIRRALRNRAVSWIRQQQQRRKFEALLAAQGVSLDVPSAEACASLAEQLAPLLDALEKAHPTAAEALRLVKIEGLSAKGAGERMGKSPYQVGRLVARALLFLTPALERGDTP